MKKRIFIIVLDSMGVGAMPDAAKWGNEGCDTLASAARAKGFAMPTMQSLGLFNIEGATGMPVIDHPLGAYGRMAERSNGKDTTVGHWELAGIISPTPLPTYPNGFPPEVIQAFEKAIGRKTLCNRPYSGTQVIADYGRQHVETGYPIVYTSADSVFQLAAHEDVVSVDQLYQMCRIARKILQGEHGVGRVIARPFTGQWPYTRTANRHDFSLAPAHNMLDELIAHGYDVLSVGKIVDIFAGRSISRYWRTKNNDMGMQTTLSLLSEDFTGLCFVNLVDTDMVYGHRRDIQGYGDALTRFDLALADFVQGMQPDDLLLITADHGCDPGYRGTDHTREYVPLVVYGNGVKPLDLGTRNSFADVSATVLHNFGIPPIAGDSFLRAIGLAR